MNVEDIFSTQSNVKGIQKISKRQLERGFSGSFQILENSINDTEERPLKVLRTDQTFDPEDSEEDRFFQDGLTKKEKNVFDWVDQVDEPYRINLDSARRIILKFEKIVTKNTELRLKFPSEPTKFIDSEADLDEVILELQTFSMNAKECFPFLIESGSLETLVGLMTHENKDIILDVIQVVGEWTAEDLYEDKGDDVLDEIEYIKNLINALKDLSFFQLLGSVLSSLNEDPNLDDFDNDKDGVHKILEIVENISTLDSSLVHPICSEMKLLSFLTNRIQNSYTSKEDEILRQSDFNQQYSSEILSILVQIDSNISSELIFPISENSKTGMDIILECVSKYRKKDPIDDIGFEYLENLFDILASLILLSAEAKSTFLRYEGIELICLMLEEKNFCRVMSIKLLDFVLTPVDIKSESSLEISAVKRFLDCGGYNPLCKVLMKKNSKSLSLKYPSYSVHQEQYRISSIFSYLFRLTSPNTVQRWKILSKFVPFENAPAKIINDCRSRLDRLIEIHFYYFNSLAANENSKGLSEEDFQFGLQMIDSALSILMINDEKSKDHVSQLFKIKMSNVDVIKECVLNYITETFLESEKPTEDTNKDNNNDITTDFDSIYSRLPANAKELYLSSKLL
ncbi:Beta-catenin-like protein 1-like protein [Smittium mucronatum]|uniref:Beta-catenin-like protein 1-like protein n=1 Tax=Smittium mucronatum TaxID=133383 RepID=A0A1R0H4M6_9FUNG|nr:Beta-catenin-like protein 1-like protein [Smittium mucronatum]